MMNLAEYLALVMHQKNLKPADIEERSGLSVSYIGRLLNGQQSNLTVETIGILSEALEVDAFELFAAAHGKPMDPEKVDPLVLIDTMQKIALNPEFIELVQDVSQLSKKHKKSVSDIVKALKPKKAKKKQKS